MLWTLCCFEGFEISLNCLKTPKIVRSLLLLASASVLVCPHNQKLQVSLQASSLHLDSPERVDPWLSSAAAAAAVLAAEQRRIPDAMSSFQHVCDVTGSCIHRNSSSNKSFKKEENALM